MIFELHWIDISENRQRWMKPFSSVEEHELLFYQIKIVIKPYKTDEFVKSMRSFARRIRKEKAVLVTACTKIWTITIAEVLKTGDFKLVTEQIASQQRGSAAADWTLIVKVG